MQPLHSTGMNDLDDWIRDNLRPTLTAFGYTGGPRRYHKRTLHGCLVIEFQRSRDSWPGHSKFAINLGVWNVVLGSSADATRIPCPATVDCHVALRAGEIDPPHVERWWWVEPGDSAPVVRDVQETLVTEAIPFLERLSSNAGMLSFWDSGQSAIANEYAAKLRVALEA